MKVFRHNDSTVIVLSDADGFANEEVLMQFDWLKYLDNLAGTEESLFDASARVLVDAAMGRCDGEQREAAKLLKVSPRVMNYKLAQFKKRPVDLKRHDSEESTKSVRSSRGEIDSLRAGHGI